MPTDLRSAFAHKTPSKCPAGFAAACQLQVILKGCERTFTAEHRTPKLPAKDQNSIYVSGQNPRAGDKSKRGQMDRKYFQQND